ncbi:MAG: hypothetical protein ACFCVK_08555 [Acidimicrobiales bacterium]
MLLGLGNGFGSGIVMTLGADFSPDVGRATFLGGFRFLGDVGTSAGPLLVALLTAALSLSAASLAVGAIGLAASVMVWRRLPETAHPATGGRPPRPLTRRRRG